ncbi:MAG TPA: hypothetical protein VFI54_14225 [Solirubrobacteraceae bacterium]|nr:hypothetical protein [Solirubrobacteraceae bacterium]
MPIEVSYSGGGQAEHRDVEAEGAEQSPVGPNQLVLGLPDSINDGAQGAASPVPMPLRARDRDDQHGPGNPDRAGNHGQRQAVGSSAELERQQQRSAHERKDVRRSGEEEESTGLLDDLPGRHAASAKQQAARRQRPHSSARQQGPRAHLDPR